MDKRKIILKKDQPAGTYYFGESVEAVPGELVEAKEKTAIAAVESGVFEYAPEQLEAFDAIIAETKGELPADFPAKEILAEASEPITTLEDLAHTPDEKLLAKEGIGEKTLEKIRAAEKKEGKK